MKEKEIFVLLADGAGSMRSTEQPFGVAVSSEKEARKFAKSEFSFSDNYQKVKVFKTCKEAIEHHMKSES